MKKKIKGFLIIGVLLFIAIYYYIAIPAINIHSQEVWYFGLVVILIIGVFYAIKRKLSLSEVRTDKVLKGFGLVIGALVVVFLVGSLLSSPIFNAKKYQQLMKVDEDVNFTDDIQEVSFDKIPLLDKDSAEILGDRKMGSMVDMVSQFEADSIYSQINYQGTPVRVTPLRYASLIKWFTNRGEGIPAYIKINMANQKAEIVKLEEGIKYTTSEHFNRNIYRHLRFTNPTYIYGELSFEIDEEGTPYWIAPVKDFKIGLFGGETVGKVVLCNAITGECETVKVGDVPTWVDRVFSADLLIKLFDYHGTLKRGFFNSVLSQKDCLETTDGYNYLALDDDVWMYTGVTSVNGDQSNVGFALCNQRTMETKYYEIEGATESAAMGSAEGQVQHLKYQATFPLLLNISGEPTYFIALKDDAGLVKKYAMVNVQKYQIVATGDSVSQCEEEYLTLLLSSGIKEVAKDERVVEEVTGTVTTVAQAVLDGSSHYYLVLDDGDEIYDVSVVDFIEVVKIKEGDNVTLEYKKGEEAHLVMSLEYN
ncbi:CvpA family protein [Ohessyouella blattaphilus]|uniref:CvpA family protein n=1 Tax=Ohessyouella blattaphilus TaxID=2949333 RepID=A0ABT1EG44_9FIRM|nr:CvpA family protein [Ohessyouella blattaphilus]MCP1108732.1 CvpA family protein [Ohessyouella blattaphilus]MCR8562126.1 CvpA family protein [Ohessyouella blattaphilus]MDL2249366.1 CvpA family protein [Lachnospiraceae bacterium OttesenSCG-928-J05]